MEAWRFEHTVECAAPAESAWRYWTDVRNWTLDADIERVEISGPFEAGARAVTHSKSLGPVEWGITEVETGRALLKAPAPGALAQFEWVFEEAQGGCRITQRVSLSGEKAAALAEAMGPELEAGIPLGMRKLREAIEAEQRTG